MDVFDIKAKMRRSAAPSQGSQAKRPRFNVPFKSPCQNTVIQCQSVTLDFFVTQFD